MHVVEEKTTIKSGKGKQQALMPKFKCRRCGACCRSIAGVEGFEELDNGTGVCIYLDKDTNLCLIYSERPTLCNIEETYRQLLADTTSWEDYLAANYESCVQLRALHGIPEK